MGVFFRDFPMEAGEVVRVDVPANLYRHGRAIGGRLAVTDRAVLFEPNWLDFVALARGRRVDLADILRTEVLPGERSLNPHRARTMVKIELLNGKPILIAVADADALVRSLRQA